MDAYERFSNPAAYVVEQMMHAQFKTLDEHTIKYQNVVISFDTIESKMNDINITGEQSLSFYCLENIIKCYNLLAKEEKFHNIKFAVLRTPKPKSIKISEYFELSGGYIYIGYLQQIEYYNMPWIYKLYGNGRLECLQYVEKSRALQNYVWTLSRQIVDG